MNYCTECGDECPVVEETFDYVGTHCTHGNPGTHHTGIWVSNCCLADVTDEPEEQRQEDRPLADGKIKTSTGYVEEPTCTDRSDFAPDLGSNKP